MNTNDMNEFMKIKYPGLVDFDNLQFVKDCEEEGIKKYKNKVIEAIEKVKRNEHSYLDNYQTALIKLEKELELNGGGTE